MPSFYYPFLFEKGLLNLEGDEFHHLVNVSRHRVGDEIKLNNGMGNLAYTKIESINKKYAQLEIHKIESFTKGSPEIGVAFSLLKNKNDLWLIEKLTEIGVKHFFPMETRFSVRRIIDKKNKESDPIIDKMTKITIAAIKQCDNAFLPIIYPINSLEHTLLNIQKMDFIPIVASEQEKEQSLISLVSQKVSAPYCFFIGPEGGFHPDEFNHFIDQQVKTFTLGNHIQRAETAAINVASVISALILESNKEYY